jgi:RHS repeat-associated protein
VTYANPDAVTQIANGLSTTTFQFDQDGNVTQKLTDGVFTTYQWDYANRLIALGSGGATTTYGYDAFGTRVLQTGTSTTTLYPFKWYSVASSTGTGAKYSTTTDYVFNGDSLVGTVDQETASGNATGTAKIRYIHPDHLGSTNIVTDENDNVVQTLDFYPCGSTRISVATSTNEKRQFIGQFTDDSALSYLNARFYDSSRGQFLSQDPIFQQLGSPDAQNMAKRPLQQILSDPQALNSYSYAEDNPISIKDPSGLMSQQTQSTLNAIVPLLGQLVNLLSQIVVQLGGGGSHNPISASTALLAHSTTLNPAGVNIITANQQSYGNLVNKIQNSSDFTNYVDDQIRKNSRNGTLNIPAGNDAYSFPFQSGDLFASLHNVDAGLTGTKASNGTWNLHVTISDVYNFDLKRNYGSGITGKAVTTLNNSAFLGQQLGVITDYPVLHDMYSEANSRAKDQPMASLMY